MGVPSLNDLAVDGTLNTTNQPTNHFLVGKILGGILKGVHFSSLNCSYHSVSLHDNKVLDQLNTANAK